MSLAITKVLQKEGYILSYEEFEKTNTNEGNNWPIIAIGLKYSETGRNRKSVITTLKRVSKPGLRVYASSNDLPNILGNFGIAIVSTSKGVMTNIQAKKLGVGGEILCYVW
jgi:small subunit ribosomal protein S8